MYMCTAFEKKKKINSAEELKRFIDTTIIILILKYFYAELPQRERERESYRTVHKQFMAAQMFGAMLREGDERLGLQIE